MVEDEDSKARRNFMAVSTAIVLAWWLQAPLDKISERLLGSSVGPGFEWRAWFAAIVALVYFALRFRFSADHLSAAKERTNSAHDISKRLLFRWLRWETLLLVRWGVRPLIFGDGFGKMFRTTRELPNGEVFSLRHIEISDLSFGSRDAAGQLILSAAGGLNGTVHVVAQNVSPGGAEDWRTLTVGFALTILQHHVLRFSAFVWMMLYSQVSISLFVPWFVGCFALAISTVRLIRTF